MLLEDGAAGRSKPRIQVLPNQTVCPNFKDAVFLQYQPHWEPRALKGYHTPYWGPGRIKNNRELDGW